MIRDTRPTLRRTAPWAASRAALALVLAASLALAACAGGAVPAPPAGEPPVPPAEPTPPPERTLTAAVYFADWQAQHVIPEARQVPEAEGAALAQRIVEEILAGPTDPHLRRTLPDSLRLLEPVAVQNRVAYLNFSPEFLSIHGAAGVLMALGSLRLSLTEVPGIDKVQVLVDGKKDVEMDEGVLLEPMDRGPIADYPVLMDPERARYLQNRVDQGLDAWRTDPREVVKWEGRMFGFTAAELAAATLAVEGTLAHAEVARGDDRYTIELVRNDGSGENRIWLIRHIARAEAEPPSYGGNTTGAGPFPAVTVEPVDEAADDPTLAAFLDQLRQVVARRDVAALEAMLDPQVSSSFGGDTGVAEFRRFWELEQDPAQSRLWPLLETLLARGGAFSSPDRKTYAIPYAFVRFPTELDPYVHALVAGEKVAIRAEPRLDAPVVQRVSHLVVRNLTGAHAPGPAVEMEGQVYHWQQVGLPSGEMGWVVDRYLLSPLGYRLGLTDLSGRGWTITFLVAGD